MTKRKQKMYRFTRDVNCDGLECHAGMTIVEGDIPAGRMGPMLRTGWVEEFTENEATNDKESEA